MSRKRNNKGQFVQDDAQEAETQPQAQPEPEPEQRIITRRVNGRVIRKLFPSGNTLGQGSA